MGEAINKRIKYDFLYHKFFDNILSLQKDLPDMVKAYNNKPHTALFGFYPKEVFSGIQASRSNFLSHFGIEKGAQNSPKHTTCGVCE